VRLRRAVWLGTGFASLLIGLACCAIWATAASAAVSPPNVFKSFEASSIPQFGSTTLDITIINPNQGTGLTSVNFTDTLPAGLIVKPVGADLSSDCGGTATAGGASVTLSGAALGPIGACIVSVNVTGTWGGVKSNSVTVGSSAGSSNPSTAMLTVAVPPAPTRIYFSNSSTHTVSFANADGTGGGDLPTGSATLTNPWDVALDPAHGRIYWANTNNTISYANLDGSGGGDITISGVLFTGAIGLAIDPVAGRLYWSDGNGINYANLDGSAAQHLNHLGATIDFPQSLALDPASGRIYWVNSSATPKLSYANLDGSGGHDLTITGATVNDPYGIGVDDATGRIYWSNLNNTIGSANLDGGAGADLSTGTATVQGPAGVAIDTAAGRVYWTNSGSSMSISSVNLNGTGGQNLSVISGGNQFPALLEAPAAAGAPTITGGSAPGSLLSCSTGTWAGDQPGAHFYRAPQSFTYQWLLNGSPIGGATTSTYAASSTGSYACAVTASNFAGSGGKQTSPPFAVKPPVTGKRAAALKKCKKKHGKARKKCKKKARLLPV
jgi:DNA-binding beta-propeller fold protein YncE